MAKDDVVDENDDDDVGVDDDDTNEAPLLVRPPRPPRIKAGAEAAVRRIPNAKARDTREEESNMDVAAAGENLMVGGTVGGRS